MVVEMNFFEYFYSILRAQISLLNYMNRFSGL